MQDPLLQPRLPDDTVQIPVPTVSNRRTFLKGAVITAAGVTAAGITAFGVETPAHPKAWHIIQNFCGFHPPPSGPNPITLCFEDRLYDPVSTFDVNPATSPHPEFFLWFTYHGLPAGRYTLTYVVVNVEDFSPNTTTYRPFGLVDPSQNAFEYLFPLTSPADDCPSAATYSSLTPAVSAYGLDKFVLHTGQPPTTAINPLITTQTQDVQVKLHLRFTGTFGTHQTSITYKFQAALKNNVTHAISYSPGLTVTAKLQH
jgi:hypothetical protein